ncbi:hypothetical protein CBR_g11103 [Chara braunii]|uniref:NECAP PHear domain-containing protein n=1 Tax=Chara braunii TaxID=69332 RepID=A0A388KQ21_CHABU|nr:hypothetical protein CBR_g11103 [Chara braunii]|eukprot:GBG72170.1 hypothetical protein CBR_g11103 [Chara braunii]
MESSMDGESGKGVRGEDTHEATEGSLENGRRTTGQPSQDATGEAATDKDREGQLAEGSTPEKKEGMTKNLDDDDEDGERAELILFQVKECYVYKIPPRKSNLSYRADEWDINKWTWQGAMRIVSKGTECSIRLEDPISGELFAQAPVRATDPFPVEGVVDSSRFFVLRVEDSSGPHVRHAFVGLGFRERTQAYDFNAALQDHLKYVNRKKEAEEVAEEYKHKPSADYSLKEGQTLRLEIRTSLSPGAKAKLSADGTPMKLLTRGSMLFSDQRTTDVKGAAAAGAGGAAGAAGASSAGIALPSLPPPPKPGEYIRRPSLEGLGSAASKTSAGASPSILHLIIPPPHTPARMVTSPPPVAAAASPVSDRPSPVVSSDPSPDDEDFGDFQTA